jgi:hypothetical protein
VQCVLKEVKICFRFLLKKVGGEDLRRAKPEEWLACETRSLAPCELLSFPLARHHAHTPLLGTGKLAGARVVRSGAWTVAITLTHT